MTFTKIAAAVTVSALALTGAAHAQIDGTADASANILQALQITNDADLDFADIVPGAVDAVVTVSAGGSRVCSPDLTCLGDVTAAQFTVSGAEGADYSVSMPTSTTISAPGGATMTVNNFTNTLSNDIGNLASGADTFTVGASLTVSSGQASGAYTGQFDVTVQYN